MNPPVPNRRYQSEFAIQQKYYHETADDYDPMHLPANEEYDLALPILPVFNNYKMTREKCSFVERMNPTGEPATLYRAAGHIALLGLLK